MIILISQEDWVAYRILLGSLGNYTLIGICSICSWNQNSIYVLGSYSYSDDVDCNKSARIKHFHSGAPCKPGFDLVFRHWWHNLH